ncbi:MAG: sigma 54-interacting transcriptional regulator [Deltaproteobacteria bacterium]|nr:sigma 54-interacting transcriptional regulator [Deltaproteobacteria bacterium]
MKRPIISGPAGNANDQAQQLKMLSLILDSIYNGVVVVDAQGYITHFNKPYGKFLGIDAPAQIGKHVTEVIENTRMHIVGKTGKCEINHVQRIKGQDMVVQRIPIWQEGKVVAVFGQVMFKDVRDVGKLASKLSLLESKVKYYEKELLNLRSTRYTFDSIIGVSKAIVSLKQEACRAASTGFPVLISGESGTGKELFAQAIHHASGRKMHPFIRINCAAIPKDLLESELFGYEKGAFTGAREGGKTGKFELAQQGSIFLDEIGDLPLEMQPKLLRVLEEKEFERIGGNSLIRIDFRPIAATNQDLKKLVAEGRFRRDLLYRLNVITLHIPPLRERREDIIPLSNYLLRQIAEDFSLPQVTIGPRAVRTLINYDWPGNVRELSNVLERTLSYLEGDKIHLADLPFHLQRHIKLIPAASRFIIKLAQSSAEKETIQEALEATEYNKAQAAKLLGIHRTLLYKKMKKHNLPLSPKQDYTKV